MDTQENITIEANGKATEEQIAVWRKTHKEVHEIEVKGHYGYVHGFNRETLKYMLSQLSMKIDAEKKSAEFDMEKIVNIGEVGLQHCWLGGSSEIHTDDNLWIGAAMQVGMLINITEGSIKKL